MNFFVSVEPAPTPQSSQSGHIATALAGVVTTMLVMQLFTFEEFTELATHFGLPGLDGVIFASLVIVFELLSLPFLLRMDLGRAFRFVSIASLVAAMVLWMYSTVIVVMRSTAESVGFSGGLGTLTPGWWAVAVVAGLWAMSAWAIWGLAPRRNGLRRTER